MYDNISVCTKIFPKLFWLSGYQFPEIYLFPIIVFMKYFIGKNTRQNFFDKKIIFAINLASTSREHVLNNGKNERSKIFC